ncbi:MAG: hypothetical protein MI924_25530 [Chloroflexales bacterium]|nr:hypothetical protein [Chloroflexales bacterium]
MHRLQAFIARLPLPMLALAASYGVYTFNLLFVPVWVALVSAAAYELTYVALAFVRVADAQRRRAAIIALAAVVVSVLYNSLSGLFHRRPDLLISPPLWADVTLAVLHGLPLAIVAYNVAVLLLHDEQPAQPTLPTAPDQPTYPAPVLVAPQLADEYQRGLDKQAETLAQCDAVLPTATGRSASPRCPHCGSVVASNAHKAAAVRHGHCKACKPVEEGRTQDG